MGNAEATLTVYLPGVVHERAMQNSPVPNWLPLTEAGKLLDACSDRASALRDLDDLIARGGVRAWATGIVSLYRTQAASSQKQATSSRQPSGPVQPATWETVRGGPLEPAMWATGVLTLPATETATGLVLRGIRLEREPFLRLLDEYAVAGSIVPNKIAPVDEVAPAALSHNRAPGGTTKWREWDRMWSAVVNLAIDDRLNRAEFPSQAKLMDAVRENAGDELFSDRILKPVISKIYREFVQPN